MYGASNIQRFYLMPLPLSHQCFWRCCLSFLTQLSILVSTPQPLVFHVVTTVKQSHSDEVINQGDNGDIIKEKPHPNHVPSDPGVNSDLRPAYTWTKSGHTECSTTCGTGENIHIILTSIFGNKKRKRLYKPDIIEMFIFNTHKGLRQNTWTLYITPMDVHLPGRRHVLWECVDKVSQTTVPADLCDPDLEPTKREEDCNIQSCPA